MPTVKVCKVVEGMPRSAKVGDDVEIEEGQVEKLRALGAIDNVRRVLIAEAGQLGADFSHKRIA